MFQYVKRPTGQRGSATPTTSKPGPGAALRKRPMYVVARERGLSASPWLGRALSSVQLTDPREAASRVAARAQVGTHAEGQPGVERGPSEGTRIRLGVVSGDSFVPATEPEAAPAMEAETETTAQAEQARAFTTQYGTPQRDTTSTQASVTVRIQDETRAQVKVVTDAVVRARALTQNALTKLGNPRDPLVSTALMNNFHTTNADAMAKVRAQLTAIQAAFSGTIPIEVETSGQDRAYVYALWSDIHLTPVWFADPDPDGRARTIIHEMSHKYGGTDDEAYHWQASFATLSTKDALDNADSYAWFCIDVR